MAFGEHWEWRAFGEVAQELRKRILGLPPLLPEAWQVEDRYLYAPGCTVNVKLRSGDLKLKRFRERNEELDRWLEDPADIYPFPLTPAVVAQTAASLGVTLPASASRVLDQQGLLALLTRTTPPARVVAVSKTRWLRSLGLPGLTPDVLVELAEITAPQAILSVALEHPLAEPVRRARALLGLDTAPLTPMSYLDALAHWAHGQPLPLRP